MKCHFHSYESVRETQMIQVAVFSVLSIHDSIHLRVTNSVSKGNAHF